jgi:hypothetical protein
VLLLESEALFALLAFDALLEDLLEPVLLLFAFFPDEFWL